MRRSSASAVARVGAVARVALAAGVAFGGAAATPRLAAQQKPGPGAPGVVKPRTLSEDIQMFSGVLNQIRVNHPDSVDTHELIMGAIQGMLKAADPHSFAIPALRFNAEKDKAWREGKLYPVGIDFAVIAGYPVVVSVIPGSSAAKADILPGDELVLVDGEPVRAESAFELDVLLAGPRNSTVKLTVERRRSDGSLAVLERVVKRERIGEITAVPSVFMLDGQTGYVRITTFDQSNVSDDLHDALGKLEKQGMKRLVLDLRGNGGGSVGEAAKVAGEFLPKGAVVYTSEGRKKEVIDTGRVERSFWSREKRYPIVVMVNHGTASASELVAGALQDYDRALIVGRPSFGKSLQMRAMLLPDGSLLWLVVGHMKTPCGRVIQRQYRNITVRNYIRYARAERDTLGRPSCKTAAGRTVYGGGGIYPDVRLPEPEPTPAWLARVREELLPLRWIGGHLSASAGAYASLDALAASPAVSTATLTEFRRFAAEQGVTLPEGADVDRRLQDELVLTIADARWGQTGFYRLTAVIDQEVKSATAAFGRAAALLAAGGQ